MSTETVKVVVRVRPLNSNEKAKGSQSIIEVDRELNQISIMNTKSQVPKSFAFDAVYDTNCTQQSIYDESAFPLVESVLEGYNGTIFAYGQTGCGKTFTMVGDPSVQELKGIIPNSFAHVFGYIGDAEVQNCYLVRISYTEIYNEEIRDLLNYDPKTKLELREDKDKGIFVKNLSLSAVKCIKDIETAMEFGNKHRVTKGTNMNETSSRSHAIFTIYIESSETTEGRTIIRAGKLNLVDLAGSEKQKKTGAEGDRLKEAIEINLSLSALGNVISALVDGNVSHVPYRDSKLTRLLQDSLGGNTKTVMIAVASPADYNYEESLSTLRYASRAKFIKNKPKVNEDPKDALIRQYAEEIEKLRKLLSEKDNPIPLIIEKFIEREIIVEIPVKKSKKRENNQRETDEGYSKEDLNLAQKTKSQKKSSLEDDRADSQPVSRENDDKARSERKRREKKSKKSENVMMSDSEEEIGTAKSKSSRSKNKRTKVENKNQKNVSKLIAAEKLETDSEEEEEETKEQPNHSLKKALILQEHSVEYEEDFELIDSPNRVSIPSSRTQHKNLIETSPFKSTKNSSSQLASEPKRTSKVLPSDSEDEQPARSQKSLGSNSKSSGSRSRGKISKGKSGDNKRSSDNKATKESLLNESEEELIETLNSVKEYRPDLLVKSKVKKTGSDSEESSSAPKPHELLKNSNKSKESESPSKEKKSRTRSKVSKPSTKRGRSKNVSKLSNENIPSTDQFIPTDQITNQKDGKERLDDLVADFNKKLISGGEALDNSEKTRMKELREFRLKLKQQKKREKQLMEDNRKKEEEMLMKEKNYLNLQEEVDDLRKVIKKLRLKYKSSIQEIEDLNREHEYDREALLDTIRARDQDSEFNKYVLNQLLAQNELIKIRQRSKYDYDNHQWKIPEFIVQHKQTLFPKLPKVQVKDMVQADKEARRVEVKGDFAQVARNQEAENEELRYAKFEETWNEESDESKVTKFNIEEITGQDIVKLGLESDGRPITSGGRSRQVASKNVKIMVLQPIDTAYLTGRGQLAAAGVIEKAKESPQGRMYSPIQRSKQLQPINQR